MVIEKITQKQAEKIILDAANYHYESRYIPALNSLSPEMQEYINLRYGKNEQTGFFTILRSEKQAEKIMRNSSDKDSMFLVFDLFFLSRPDKDRSFARKLDSYKSLLERSFICSEEEYRSFNVQKYISRLKNDLGFRELRVSQNFVLDDGNVNQSITNWFENNCSDGKHLDLSKIKIKCFVRDTKTSKVLFKVKQNKKEALYVVCDLFIDDDHQENTKAEIINFLYKTMDEIFYGKIV